MWRHHRLRSRPTRPIAAKLWWLVGTRDHVAPGQSLPYAMKSALTFCALLGALTVTGCDNDALVHRLLKHKPTAAQACGTYSLTVANVDKVGEGTNARIVEHQPVPTIELKAGGKAEFNEFPMLPDAGKYNYCLAGFKSFKASWRISSVGKVSADGSEAKEVFGIVIEPADTKQPNETLSFTGETAPDGLVLTLYDGSQGQMLEFSKLTDPAAPGAEGK